MTTATATTARDQFLALVYNGPLLRGDAIIVACGEDYGPRLEVGAQLLRQGAADRIVLSGGVDGMPRHMGAARAWAAMMGLGIAPDRLETEPESRNSREQAVAIAALAKARTWGRLLLAASSYHAPRLLLTCIRALAEAEMLETCHILPVPAAQSPWHQPPEGMTETRLALFDREMAKCAEYTAHVATWEEGLAYLKFWEGK